jgi:hypothetical protein
MMRASRLISLIDSQDKAVGDGTNVDVVTTLLGEMGDRTHHSRRCHDLVVVYEGVFVERTEDVSATG